MSCCLITSGCLSPLHYASSSSLLSVFISLLFMFISILHIDPVSSRIREMCKWFVFWFFCCSLPPKLCITPDTGRWRARRSRLQLSFHDRRRHLYVHAHLTHRRPASEQVFVSDQRPLCQASPSAAAGGASKEPASAPKDDGVFKAPPPPPKVTKTVTVPTDPCQDSVTKLKCRKEHKEVRA